MNKKTLLQAFKLMCTAKTLSEVYEENFKEVSKYVHATSRGHEAIQLAVGMQLLSQDYAFPYYRDDAMLLGIGLTPKDLMAQLLAKAEDPFSGGRSYYSHPSLNREDLTKIPHNSSATGMQAIPATGAALGLKYKEQVGIADEFKNKPIVVCSLGDASVTEGEVSEAMQMAALKQLPILFLVQDNEWDISASADEIRAQDAYEFAAGFKGLSAYSIDGTDFAKSYSMVNDIMSKMRTDRKPVLLHATVPLLNHHTSGVRMEWYRDDLDEDRLMDPYPKLRKAVIKSGVSKKMIKQTEKEIYGRVVDQLDEARQMNNPDPLTIFDHIFAETLITDEVGERSPEDGEEVVMVDAALHAIEEIMTRDKRCLLYGQDVGHRLGGVFREAATLAQKFGNERVFNTPIQEAFIVGSTVGMSAVGLKPIVEVQFADYIWPGLNQLFTEVSRSCYLSNGKWPVSMILRVPIGAYGSGGPYHSGSVESVVANIRGVKIAYPSNGADLKGLMKSAYDDPNPVIIFEHKGLYWSKVKGTDKARTIEPDADYRVPFGKCRVVQSIPSSLESSLCIITYGMGVHWALNASKNIKDQVEIIDLRTLAPLDYEGCYEAVKRHGRCLIITEEPTNNSFAQALAGNISEHLFEHLDAPVQVIGSLETPAIPLNSALEQSYLPSVDQISHKIVQLLGY